MNSNYGHTSSRPAFLRAVVIGIFVIIVLRLAYIQLLDGKYGALANDNYMRYVTQYPVRGQVYDRNGEYLIQNRECYDLMVVWRDMDRRGIDTVSLARLLGMSPRKLRSALADARLSPRVPYRVTKYLDKQVKFQLDELNIRGFYTVPRTIRQYPLGVGGNLLGSLSEASPELVNSSDEYSAGDLVGSEGLEAMYEDVLKGVKGLLLHDLYAPVASRDSVLYEAIPGKSITCTIDARLQLFAEELLDGKVGAVVAIEPSTGGILAIASSPTFDPNDMVGRERGNNYMRLLANPRRPLFNRAIKSRYPPGSTFKIANGLIGLEEGVLHQQDMHPCSRGYTCGKIHVGCHSHPSPLNLSYAIATSCNAYFCYVFRDILENRKYGGSKDAFEVWREYVNSFGFGQKLDTDLQGEARGFVPDREFYDRKYRKSWNSLTVLSLAIGQGELGCTPLQLANMAATIANRGYYYVPHIVQSIEGEDSIDVRFRTRHYTMVRKEYYDIVARGMWRGVNVDGTCRGAMLEGYDVCGKTGTAQNPSGADHSTFISFAPLNSPRIAIAVYVEHGGFGAETAVPIASLIEEMYLTDTIRRPYLVDYVKNRQINYYMYDRKAHK